MYSTNLKKHSCALSVCVFSCLQCKQQAIRHRGSLDNTVPLTKSQHTCTYTVPRSCPSPRKAITCADFVIQSPRTGSTSASVAFPQVHVPANRLVTLAHSMGEEFQNRPLGRVLLVCKTSSYRLDASEN